MAGATQQDNQRGPDSSGAQRLENRSLFTCRGPGFLAALWLLGLILLCGVPGGDAWPAPSDHASTSGAQIYRPNHWGQIQAWVTNATDAAVSPWMLASFDAWPHVQFATRPWIPAHAQRRISLDVHLPVHKPADSRAWNAQVMRVDPSAQRERLQNRSNVLLLAAKDRITSLIVTDTTIVREMVGALRVENRSLSAVSRSASPRALPREALGWDGVDTAIIAHPQADQLGAAQYQAMRQWLVGGGRLWIMLDRTPQAFAQRLLGDQWNVVIRDRVASVSLSMQFGKKTQDATWDYPVDMLRVIAPDWNVTHTVQGYPAAMNRKVGRGQVYLTTLEAKAWLTPENHTTAGLNAMRGWLKVNPHQKIDQQIQQALKPFADQQIGYHILSFASVARVLGVYLLTLVVVGGWLSRRRQLHWFALISVVLSLMTAAGLIVAGRAQQTRQPTTLAVARVGFYDAHQPYVDQSSRVSVYRSPHTPASTLSLTGTSTRAWPNLGAQGGQPMRWTRQGSGAWRLDQLNLPSGAVTQAQTSSVQPLNSPAYAQVSWDQQGHLVGTIQGDAPRQLKDAILISEDGHAAVRFRADATFTTTPNDALAKDQFISATVLSQAQQMRLAVYRSLLNDFRFTPQTRLMGWTSDLPADLSLGASVSQRHDGLLSFAVRYDKPHVGGRMTLPFALLKMSRLRHHPGTSTLTAFDPTTRTFVSNLSYEGMLMMRFAIPQAVLPMSLDQATVRVEITALGREVSLVVYRDGKAQVVATMMHPHQLFSYTLRGKDLPTLTPQGWVGVGVRVGPAGPGQSASWTLSQLKISLTGTSQAGDKH